MLRIVHQSFAFNYAESLVVYHAAVIQHTNSPTPVTKAAVDYTYSAMCAQQEALNSEAKYQAQLST